MSWKLKKKDIRSRNGATNRSVLLLLQRRVHGGTEGLYLLRALPRAAGV